MSPTATLPSGLVAITGASGFVGAHVLREALSRGYQVRSIVRSKAKGSELLRLFPSSSHSVAYVSDVRNKAELSEAFRDVTYVQHVASPYTMQFTDPEKEMLEPAIQGTQAVLEAAHATPSVRHVLITSSFAAQNDLDAGGSLRDYTYTEKDWNPATYEAAVKSDMKVYTYCASKALAEKSAWDFVKEKSPSFALTTFCPPGIIGPIAHPLRTLDDLNTSCANVWNVISGRTDGVVPATLLPQTVDVRDVATAHVNAMSVPEAQGERFSLCGYYFDWQHVVDLLRERIPEHADTIPAGEKGTTGQKSPVAKLDSAKAERILGIRWIGWQDSFEDLSRQLWALQANVQAGKAAL